MTSLRTLNSVAFPDDVADPNLPVEWAAGVSGRVLEWTWVSFERLKAKSFRNVDFSLPIVQLERALTQLHCLELQFVIIEESDGYCSFTAMHESDEFESLKSATAKPPANDIGFIHRDHCRWIWPIEAKVVPTVKSLADYLSDVDKFKNGVAAPLVGEGAVIGYLLAGLTKDFLDNVAKHGGALSDVDGYSNERHRCSLHDRSAPYPKLRLHHMAMSCN